jgi:hypothetical protein
MSQRSIIHAKTLGLSFVMTILMVIVSAFVPLAHADPIEVFISPANVAVGSTVTVTGINATENGEVRIYLLGSLFLTSTKANETGGYSVNLTVPAIPSDTYPVVALDLASGDTASEFFTVEPRILLTPNSGSYDDRVTAKGDGFASLSNVTLRLNGIDVTPFFTPHTDHMGSFETSFYVPSTPNGTYSVDASDTVGNTASAPFIIVPEIAVSPTSGSPSAFVFASGYGFAPTVNVTIHFGFADVTVYPTCIISMEGSFYIPFFVPNVPDGTYLINASDALGNTATTPFTVPSPILTLTPDRANGSSIVTAKGAGFQPYSPVVLYLEDIVTTNLVDLMWTSEKLMPQKDGSFEYSFMVPITNPGVYDVAAFQTFGESPSDLNEVASAILTICEKIPLDAQVNVGSVHFRGEMAEFYLKTALSGKLVDIHIDKATLYFLNGSLEEDLSGDIMRVSTGFYRIPYAIQSTAPLGTYVLLVQGSYETQLTQAFGTASGSFLLSPTLTAQNAQLLSIDNQIGTIVIPDLGTIKANLSSINAKLVDIDGKVATVRSDIGVLRTDVNTINATLTSINGKEAIIQSDLGSLKTTTNAIHAKVTSIDGDMATVSSDLGTVKLQTADSGSQTNIATVFAAIAAIVATISALLIYRRKTPSSPPITPKKETPPPPATEDAPTKVPTPPEAVQAPTESPPSTAIAIPQQPPVPTEPQTIATQTEKAPQQQT